MGQGGEGGPSLFDRQYFERVQERSSDDTKHTNQPTEMLLRLLSDIFPLVAATASLNLYTQSV